MYVHCSGIDVVIIVFVCVCVCVVCRIQPPAPGKADEFGYGIGEDLYECVGAEDMDGGPSLPPMNSPHRPPPSQAPPGIPGSWPLSDDCGGFCTD